MRPYHWLITLVFFTVWNSSTAQSSNYQLQASPLKEVLNQLSLEQQIIFAYPSDIVSSLRCAEKSINYNSTEELIAAILEGTNLEYYTYDDSKFLLRTSSSDSVEETITIRGQVVDGETGENLPLATVYLEDFTKGVFTDENGSFEMQISKNNQLDLVIRYLGYETFSASPENLDNQQVISLELTDYQLEAPVIEYVLPPMLNTSRGSLISQHDDYGMAAYASGIFGRDLMRYLQLVSGVNAFEDDNSELKIRGSGSEATRVILDGLPLYNVSHYYGIFSAVNSDYISSLELYKNAQPVEQEGLGGGTVFFTSSKEDSEDILNVNLLTASGSLSFPLNSNSTFKIAGRSSYRNVNDSRILDIARRSENNIDFQSSSPGLISSQPLFRFYDLNTSFNYINKSTAFSINFFRSYDNLINDFELQLNLPNQNIEKQIFSNTESWNNTAGGFDFSQAISKSIKLKLSSYISHYEYASRLNSEIRNENGPVDLANTNMNELTDLGLKAMSVHTINGAELLYGMEWKRLDLRQELDAEGSKKLISYNSSLSYTSLFSSLNQNFGSLQLLLGTRVPIYKTKNKTRVLFSPQLSIRYGSASILKASVSKTNQILREVEYENRLGQNQSFFRLSTAPEIPVLESWNYMIGFEKQISLWSLDVEAYYKTVDGNLLLSTDQPGFSTTQGPPRIQDYKLFRGRRRVIGVDMTLGYSSRLYKSWLAYTLSSTEDKYPQVFRGNYFSSQDDRRHQLKWINQLEAGHFSVNTNFIYTTGRPYLALENIDPSINRNNLDKKEVLKMLPDYFRVDLGMAYSFDLAKTNASLGLSVYNLTNRSNVKYIQYAYRFTAEVQGMPKNIVFGNESELIGRSLNLEFRLEF